MTKIIAFAGKKQSGKNTCCSFLHGYQLRSFHLVDEFGLDEEGSLVVNTMMLDASGEAQKTMGALDITRTDTDFSLWAASNMWPFVKHYSFASALKEICVGLFGLSKEQCYGSDIDKNKLTWFRWSDMPGYKGKKKDRMTAREFMQYVGTDIFRYIHPSIWTDRTLSSISSESPALAVISDCRFQNEVEAVQRAGGKVVKLTRGIDSDGHSSETSVDKLKGCDAVIDNSKLTVEETNGEIVELMNSWGWLGSVIEKPKEKDPDNLVGGIQKIKE